MEFGEARLLSAAHSLRASTDAAAQESLVSNSLLVLAIFAAAPNEHSFDAEIDAAIADVAHIFSVPNTLVRAVIKTESAFRVRAESPCGARGLMQVMPFNATKLGLTNADELWVPRLNILAGVRLLAVLLKHYEGDVIAALVAYNSGPKAKLAPVPANGETPGYVARILRLWRAFDAERADAAK
ncbi:MAG: lytic transglycosylase domain-containing protein [Archangium sp.]